MSKIKPCKCGSKNIGIVECYHNGDTSYTVICCDCFNQTKYLANREEAIDRWNRREYE